MSSEPVDPVKTVFVLGHPGYIGGATSEMWATIRLWRKHGVSVCVIPTWTISAEWQLKLERAGCRVAFASDAADLANIPGLAWSTVVSFCNTTFLESVSVLRKLKCRLVWAGCMNYLFPQELQALDQFGPFDAHVFQSQYQRATIGPRLRRAGVTDDLCHQIPGMFFIADHPYGPRPHARGSEFFVGAVGRADVSKFAPNAWQIYSMIAYAPKEVGVLGWSPELESRLGKPPSFASTFEVGSMSAQAFLASLHVLMPTSIVPENWPRAGLEAMSTGAVLVVRNLGGWREMVEDGVTGFLCNTDEEMAFRAAQLAYDEPLRLSIAANARAWIEQYDTDGIWEQWRELLAVE